MKIYKYMIYFMNILIVSTFFILPAHVSYADNIDDKIDDLINGRISVARFPFRSLADLPPERRSKAIARINDWIGRERANAIKTAQHRFENNWPIPDTARELCQPIQSARLAEAALIMVNASSNSDALADLFELAEPHLQRRREKISEMERYYIDRADNGLEQVFAQLAGRDQGANFFRRQSGEYFMNTPPAIKTYVHKLADYQYCIELNQTIDYYKKFIEHNGWPKRSVYGKAIERNLFLVVQHATNEPQLMQDILQKLALLAEEQETNSKFYPDLHDKISAHIGEPQLFGTFVTCQNGRSQAYGGIKDPETIDMRRQKYGLRPYAERLKDAEASCTP